MVALLDPADVLVFAPDADPDQVRVLVDEVCGIARSRVPALSDLSLLTTDQILAVSGRLRTAVLRYLESGDGSVTTRAESAPGGYSESVTVQSSGRRGILTDFDIEEILKILGSSSRREAGKAFSLARSGWSPMAGHEETCAVLWGGACDCSWQYRPGALVWPSLTPGIFL